jgi:TRAP-type mannitol/chloroaromatic compound transport system permease small subunit
LFALTLPYVERSWLTLEGSPQPSGLPFVYLLKTIILVFAALIGLQGVAQAIHAALTLSAPARQPSR